MRQRILMLASRSPYPLSAGYRLRMHYLAKLLARHYKVDLLCLNPVNMDTSKPSPFTKVFTFPVSMPIFGLNALQYWVRGLPLQVGGYFNNKANRWIKEHTESYDILYIHHIRMATYAAKFKGCRILDYHDAISMHYRESKNYAKGLWRLIYMVEGVRLLRYELNMLRRFTGAFINSSVDRDYLLKHNKGIPHCPLEVLPMGVREEALNYPDVSEEFPWIVMTGRMAYYPNREGAFYFAHNVFPKLKRRYRDLEFYIVGSDPTAEVRKLALISGVHVMGYVPDPWSYIARARVVVAPIRLGAGVQNKVLEAMALRKPLVATSLAIQGIEGAVNGCHFLLADTCEQMVDKVSNLLAHKKQRVDLGQQARLLIKQKYTWECIGDRLFKALEKWG